MLDGEMAAKQLDREALTCPICLDLLTDPVTITCGHSYCMKCLQNHWNQQVRYKCPECRQRFSSRPVLGKNIMLAALVEQLKKTEPSSDHYAGPQDVSCDVCTGRKLKAVRSCLQCVVSFCESHLQPHRDVPVLQKHQLVSPSNKLQENICHEHNKLKEIFCRTDQTIICYLCSVDKHKSHDTVSSAAERVRRQTDLEANVDLLQNRVQQKERDLQRLQQEAQDISLSAQTAVQRSGDMFKEMVLLLEKRRSEVEQQIRSEEQIQLGRVRELQDQLQQEVSELKRSISELEELSNSPDHNQVILHCPLVTRETQRTEARIPTGQQEYFEDVIRALAGIKDKLKVTLEDLKLPEPQKDTTKEVTKDMKFKNVVYARNVLFSREHPARKDLLKYSQPITLDPDTAHPYLSLSEEYRRVSLTPKSESLIKAKVLSKWVASSVIVFRVLSREGMTGRCYWEVNVNRARTARIAVSYKDMNNPRPITAFGDDDKSWAFEIDLNYYLFRFNNVEQPISGLVSSIIGVYLDHRAGVLSFYSVSRDDDDYDNAAADDDDDDDVTLLHRVQTTFTQPLYAGVSLGHVGDTAYFPKLK